MLLSDYLKMGTELEKYGVFDPVIDEDSPFFINLQRLKKTKVPEFENSYKKIHEYFRKIIKLLDRAMQRDTRDTFYREALRLFSFSEVNGINLGYAKGTVGAGFGNRIGKQVINTAYDIVKAGVDDPEFFELIPLFQENVGADRLSDMIATLILSDIETYTKRINMVLGITKEHYDSLVFDGYFLINPYKHCKILLLPVDIIHRLPVAEQWEDIDIVASENAVLRAEMNAEVANEWRNFKTYERKAFLEREIFKNPVVCKRVIEGYRIEDLDAFDPYKDFQYYLAKLPQKINSLGFNWKTRRVNIDSYNAALEIIGFFKLWVENNKGWEIIRSIDSKNREKLVQRLIHLQALSYIDANHFDMSCEPDEGRGPVDFKVSYGDDKTIIEVKLTTNSQYLHGYETQILEYGKAEKTDKLIYILIDLGHPVKVQKVKNLHDNNVLEGKKTPDLLVVDAKDKVSASKF